MTKEWRCFHCDLVFTNQVAAIKHFGIDECKTPACKLNAHAGGLIEAIRQLEQELETAWLIIHNESCEMARQMQGTSYRHGQQLRAAEESGYAKGLADGRELGTADGDIK